MEAERGGLHCRSDIVLYEAPHQLKHIFFPHFFSFDEHAVSFVYGDLAHEEYALGLRYEAPTLLLNY